MPGRFSLLFVFSFKQKQLFSNPHQFSSSVYLPLALRLASEVGEDAELHQIATLEVFLLEVMKEHLAAEVKTSGCSWRAYELMEHTTVTQYLAELRSPEF